MPTKLHCTVVIVAGKVKINSILFVVSLTVNNYYTAGMLTNTSFIIQCKDFSFVTKAKVKNKRFMVKTITYASQM